MIDRLFYYHSSRTYVLCQGIFPDLFVNYVGRSGGIELPIPCYGSQLPGYSVPLWQFLPDAD
jgi:hypothetical protein